MRSGINWDDLRVFLAVARMRTLSAASGQLRMDAATLGRRIMRLETALGVTLFVKSATGYALSDAGNRLLPAAEAAETALAAPMGAGAAQGIGGVVRIGAPDGCANFLLPQVCALIRADHPDLDIQILALPRVVNLSQREADLAITVSPPDAARLSVEKISDYKLHLAMRADLPAPQDLAQARMQSVVGYIPDMIFDKELDYLGILGRGLGKTAGASRVEMASNSVAVQLQMLRQGGIGFVHDFALPFAPELRRVLVDQVALDRAFYLVRHEGMRGNDRLSHLAQLLVGGLQGEIARLEGMAT